MASKSYQYRARHGSASGQTGWSGVIHEFIHGFLSCPCNAPQQHPLDLVIGKVHIRMALHPHERTSGLAAGERMFVGPDLRRDLALMAARARRGCDLGGSQYMNARI